MNIAVIPARGGSKRIPKKNIKNFCGKPLIAYSIETALKSELFDEVIVSTDSEEIAKVSADYGAKVQMRPKELSDDYTGTWDVIDYVVDTYEKKSGKKVDYSCTIYATAPFLQEKYLKEGYEKLKNSDACRAFSVTTMPFPIQRCFKVVNDRCEMFWPENYSKRSQDLEEAYQDAGQFYWEKRDCKSGDVFFGKDSIPIILPRYLVQDIDTPEDFKRAEYMYKAIFPNRFDKWNDLKQKIDNLDKNINIKEGNIYLISIGKNIKNETYGKGQLFLRPVLVLKKLGHNYFIGIPLTSQEKTGSYFFKFYYKYHPSYAMFNQTRTFNANRILKYHGKTDKKTFEDIKEEFKKFLC